jgi:hypothetical protein
MHNLFSHPAQPFREAPTRPAAWNFIVQLLDPLRNQLRIVPQYNDDFHGFWGHFQAMELKRSWTVPARTSQEALGASQIYFSRHGRYVLGQPRSKKFCLTYRLEENPRRFELRKMRMKASKTSKLHHDSKNSFAVLDWKLSI